MYQSGLSNLGTVIKLKFWVPAWEIQSQLQEYNHLWKPYQPAVKIKIIDLALQSELHFPQLDIIKSEFEGNIINSYFLKIKKGGFEQSKIDNATVDIFMFFGAYRQVQVCNIIDNQVVNFDIGQFYIVNPDLTKYMYSFIDDVLCLRVSIKINENSYTTILNNLDEY